MENKKKVQAKKLKIREKNWKKKKKTPRSFFIISPKCTDRVTFNIYPEDSRFL